MPYKKYYVYKQQYSEDGGITWKDTDPLVTSPSGDPIGEYATLEECQGLTPTGKKLVATYTGGTTREVDCNSSTVLTTGETMPSGYEASAMTSAVIGDCVTSISEGAFDSCSGLTSVSIPSGVTIIGNDAFYYCTSLQSITCLATTPPTLRDAVFYGTNNCPIYVPASSVSAYKSATNWSTYASRIQPIT